MKKKKKYLITESCSVFHLFSHLCFFRITSHRLFTFNFFWFRPFFAFHFFSFLCLLSWVKWSLFWVDPKHIICYNVCPTLNGLQLFVICSFVSQMLQPQILTWLRFFFSWFCCCSLILISSTLVLKNPYTIKKIYESFLPFSLAFI